MAHTVYLHVGLPKTGTTYLQSVLWNNKKALGEQNVLLPGPSPRHHMWATVVVREHPGLPQRSPEAQTSWDRIFEETNNWPGTAVISHEFFGAATAEQAGRVLADLQDAEVHLVVTARDLLTIVSSYWQEHVKHGFGVALDDFPVDGEPWDEWGWRTLDVIGVIQRWAGELPADRVHVLVLPPPDAAREMLWLQFAEVLGIDPTGFTTEMARENSSLGVVEAELLRRISRELEGFGSALDRGVWLRSYLAQGKLVPRGGDRFYPSDARVDQLRQHADRSVEFLKQGGFNVVGDLERLRVPAQLPSSRHPDSVTDSELLETATQTIAALMTDLRTLRRENTAFKPVASAAELAAPAGWRRRLHRLRSPRG